MDKEPQPSSPPPYAPQAGYPPPQGGYPPSQGGYPPPQGGYPGGYPQPIIYVAPQAQQQQQNNVVVVNNESQPSKIKIVQKEPINHCKHCIISIFFFPWLLVWLCLCLTH